MAYVKISDPNIIDISAWQQLINVVNQHSDSITALSNNFNGVGSSQVDWSSATWSHVWDPGSQALVYGKIQVVTSSATYVNKSASGSGTQGIQGTNSSTSKVFYGTASFSDPTVSSIFQFSSIPIVTATLYSGHNSSGPVSVVNSSCIVTIYNITTSGFNWRISSASGSSADTPTGTFYIMWTAAGPR